MRTLALDGGMGASGDMLLGALLAVGADASVLVPVEDALPVQYAVERVDQTGIESTAVTVTYPEADRRPVKLTEHVTGGTMDRPGTDAVARWLGDEPDETEQDGHPHPHTHAEGHGPTRTIDEIVAIVDEMDVPESVRADAVATFWLLAEAEAAVHGTDPETAHVHEVGADDAIADVVGAALLLDDLGVEQVVVTPLSTGSGTVSMAHGTYPIPPPAVVEIASRANWTLSGGPVEGELLTPTGAALLAHYADGVDEVPTMAVEQVGYGAGSRDYPDRPNVLRATLGETRSDGGTAPDLDLRSEPIAVVETTVDDVTPEVLGSLSETLPEVGALDVAVIPTTMKKSRPGHLVQVVTKPADAPAVAARLAAETGSLGVRVDDSLHRWVANRRVETVEIVVDEAVYEVGVKVATDGTGERFDASAEFDDAVAVARETGLPVREISRRAEQALEE